MKYQKGFTLMELLIVIGIVAVLASIILIATGSARGKGGDAGVKSNLLSLRTQSGLFFSDNQNSFLPAGGSILNDVCPTYYVAGGGNMFYEDEIMSSAVAQAVKDGGTPPGGADPSWCYNSSIVWATAVSLKSNSAYSWCVDSSGQSKQVNSIPQLAINATTHICN